MKEGKAVMAGGSWVTPASRDKDLFEPRDTSACGKGTGGEKASMSGCGDGVCGRDEDREGGRRCDGVPLSNWVLELAKGVDKSVVAGKLGVGLSLFNTLDREWKVDKR